MKILIIDGNINYSHSLQINFNLKGHETYAVDPGEPIENIHRQIKISGSDLLVADLSHENGLPLLELIKLDADTSRLPIFIYGDPVDRDLFSDKGADYFFSKKNVAIESLTDRIERIIINKKINEND